MQPLVPANLDLASGAPVDPASGDAWCDAADPVGEVRHVFIETPRLPERWGAMAAGERFVLGEIGLGFGRGLCTVADAFVAAAPVGTTLHLLSVERAPLVAADVARGLRWAGIDGSAAAELVAQWPAPVTGIHPVRLHGGRVRVQLIFGEAADVLPRLEIPGGVDAWCLDGFAPARDGSAWTEAVLGHVARLTGRGGTAVAWTAARVVRDGLAAGGFVVESRPGHGSTRAMTVARMPEDAMGRPPSSPRVGGSNGGVLVVGAGLAGSAVAAALADRGRRVTVLDAASPPPGGASANPRVIAEPVLGRTETAARRLRWTGWCTLLAEAWRDCGGSPPNAMPGGATCGVLHGDLPRWRAMAEALGDGHPLAVWRDAASASDIAGVPLAAGGLHVAGAGWLVPADLIARRLAAVRAAGGSVERAVAPDADAETGTADWLRRRADRAGADIIIDATGRGIAGAGGGLRIEAARGQIAIVDAIPATRGLRIVAGGRAACLPADAAGRHLIASTYDHHDEDADVRPGDHARILELLADGQPELAAALGAQPSSGAWAGIRRTTPDRVPYVGRVEGDRPTWVSLAHGSRGVVGGAMAAELIAADIGGEPAPAFRDDVVTWSPQRFEPRT